MVDNSLELPKTIINTIDGKPIIEKKQNVQKYIYDELLDCYYDPITNEYFSDITNNN